MSGERDESQDTPPREPTEAEVAAHAKRERRADKAKRDAERREAGRRR